jgi:hypothetical protein
MRLAILKSMSRELEKVDMIRKSKEKRKKGKSD